MEWNHATLVRATLGATWLTSIRVSTANAQDSLMIQLLKQQQLTTLH